MQLPGSWSMLCRYWGDMGLEGGGALFHQLRRYSGDDLGLGGRA